ncbi:hypothetical protein CEP54_002197 [Fusarium duplospermum]|uniref:Uncharacterized protein n=1 Tax=Fusarium duplospermum TaxID=1325734 RepID=A0A428QWI7_9HYPO|nr:hypothetical protein CEP54_002197 [Fusarium duplospermum]
MKDGRGRKRPADEAFDDDPKFDKIAPDGDVTFILDEGETRVRVHSAIMKNTSPVFAAMLVPHFKEGHTLREGGCAPVEIPLPENDGVAFGWICRVLHCQSDTYSWQPEPKEIVQVLDLAEKYDLLKGILLSVRFWVGEVGETPVYYYDLWPLLLACHRAQDGDLFKSISHQFLLGYPGSFVELASDTEDPGRTAYRLAAILEASRNQLFPKVFKILHVDLPEAIQGHPCHQFEDPDSECIESIEAELKLHLHRYDTSCSINQAIEFILDTLHKLCKIGCCGRCVKYRIAMCTTIECICRNLQEKVKGLCLTCFDRTSTGECTNKHGKSLVARRPVGYT